MDLLAWAINRLPRDVASGRIDWFLIWLTAGPCILAGILMAIALADYTFHISILPGPVQPQRTLKGYAAAHSLADWHLEIFGLVAAAYPAALWVLLRTAKRYGRRRTSAKLGLWVRAFVEEASASSRTPPPISERETRTRIKSDGQT